MLSRALAVGPADVESQNNWHVKTALKKYRYLMKHTDVTALFEDYFPSCSCNAEKSTVKCLAWSYTEPPSIYYAKCKKRYHHIFQ